VSAAAVILAGGSGSRVGATSNGVARNKVYLPLAGKPVLSWSLEAFLAAGMKRLVLVTKADEIQLGQRAAEMALERRGSAAKVDVIAGGTDRHGSEYAALQHLAEEIESGLIDVVAIHDGARPLVSVRLVTDILSLARSSGAAIPSIGVGDLAELREGALVESSALVDAVRVQTPQAFAAAPLLHAYRCAATAAFSATDTAGCMQQFGTLPIRCIPGDPQNLKITFSDDLAVAEQLLSLRRT
jgi:2-C-methyl-D-erythritol 4-phosphate cytidylyltransferase